MSIKEKLLKIIYFIPKMYLMLFNFIVDGETRKYVRFAVHVWTILIFGFLAMYLRELITYLVRPEPIPTYFTAFIMVGTLFPAIIVLFAKYVVIRLLGRGSFEKPANQDDKTDDKKQ